MTTTMIVIVIGLALCVAVRETILKERALRDLQECRAANEALIDTLNDRNAVGKNFNDAARLLMITRDGRMNYFMIARGDKLFTIETMGLMEDDVEQWRRDAGLEDVQT